MEFKTILQKMAGKWNFFLSFLYLLIIIYFVKLSKEVSYQRMRPNIKSNIKFSLDFCYELSVRREVCEPTYGNIIKKKNYPDNCNFELPIACYAKGFRNKTVGEILSVMRRCKIENLVKFDRPAQVDYKIHFGNICVKNRFEIDLSNGSEIINIFPTQKSQTFTVTISSRREYKDDKRGYMSPIVNIFRRFCYAKPFPKSDRNKETKYYCSEDRRNIKFKLQYFSVQSLPYPYTTDCIYRNGTGIMTQTMCYEECVKEKKSHYFMTYRDVDDKSKLMFDNASVMKPLTKKCLERCKNPDCNYGSFEIASITKNVTENGSISLEITPTDHRTIAIPLVPKTNLIYCLVIFVNLFFGLNIYEKCFKGLFLRSHIVNLDRKRQKEKHSKKLITFSFVTLLIGLAVGFWCESKLFDFGRENRIVVIKRESTQEMNVSTSICFELTSILRKNYQKNYTNDELFQKTLDELNNMTWSVRDFKSESSMSDQVKACPIRDDEKKIYAFFRDKKKCFLIYYESEQLFPHLYLQRKSYIFFNTTKFSHFYIESNFKYPQLNSPKFVQSSLFTLYQNDFISNGCKVYSMQSDGCSHRDECLQNCVLDKYVNRSVLPIFVNVKLDELDTIGKYKFDVNRLHDDALNGCKNLYPHECSSVHTTIRSKLVNKYNHNISINLTPNLIVSKELKDEDKLVVFNRIIGIVIILTGFSVREFMGSLMSIYLNSVSSRVKKLTSAIVTPRLIRRILNLIVFLFFLIHFVVLYRRIINHEMLQISYKNFLQKIVLPRIRLCYESGIDLSDGNYSKNELDKLTLASDEFLGGINFLDVDFNNDLIAINANTSRFKIEEFYLDNLKCFSISINQTTPAASANIIAIDQLVTIFVKLEKVNDKKFFVYLNADNTIDVEWSNFLLNGSLSNLYFATKEFVYNDDYYFLKNMASSFLSLFNLHEATNTQKRYFDSLRKDFNDGQYVTTTILQLSGNNSLPIKNQQFNAFMHFRSIDSNKNAWDFSGHNIETFRFPYSLYDEPLERRSESVVNKSVLALRPNFSCQKNRITNRYQVFELILHLFILIAFWLKVDLVRLSECAQLARPEIKFFCQLVLYMFVYLIIIFFDITFKLLRFFV